jgi:hydrogenase maturation protease
VVSGEWYPIRVLGCGSPRGDDSVAWEVIRQLGDAGLPAGVELHAVEGGHQLLDRLDGRGTLVLIDAISSAARPGTIHRFDWPELPIESLRPGSTHDLRPGEAIRLAATLDLLPPHVVVWGIEATRVDARLGLSPAGAAAVPELVRRIVEELNHARDVATAGAAQPD